MRSYNCHLLIFATLAMLFVYLFGCKNKIIIEEKPGRLNDSSKVSIVFVEELRFRRSYYPFDNVSEAELKKMRKENPRSNQKRDGLLWEKMEALGWVKNEKLILSAIRYDTAQTGILKDATGNELRFYFQMSEKDIKPNWLLVSQAGQIDSVELQYYDRLQDLKYYFQDIIPGGFPEMILLNQYYIMNGDNFDLALYEFRNRSAKK